MDKPVKIFYSYAHEDEAFQKTLEKHLKILERNGVISGWHRRKIGPGEEWEDQVDERLKSADIILLLVSADFIASDYCWDIEMKRALERHDAGEARVIPVIVRDVSWHSAPFGKLQALPRDGKAVKLWLDKDSAWRDVADGIEKAVIEHRTLKT